MKSLIQISVVIPVYNTEKYLKTCVNSVLKQDFDKFEIILVDDKTPDNAGAVCDEFAELNENVTVIHLEQNGGLSNARNVGIKAAKGKYLLFVDSDDSIEPGTLSAVFSVAEETDCDEVIFGYNTVVEKNGKLTHRSPVCVESAVICGKEEIANRVMELKEKVLIDSAWNKLYKKSIVDKSGVLMPVGEIFEDTEFNLQLLPHITKIAIVKDCFYNYMQRSEGSITKSYNPQKIEFLKKRSETLKRYFESLGMFNGDIEKRCNYLYIKYIYSCFIDLNFPASKLSAKEKREYIANEINADSFKSAAHNCEGKGKVGKLVIWSAKKGNPSVISFLCSGIYILKYKLQKLFFVIKGR